jgi:transcription elongation factor GreB
LFVSKAFTKDDDTAPPRFVRSRVPLPPGTPNYVTARGLAALRDERVQLDAERARREAAGDTSAVAAVAARIADLDGRIGGAVVVPAPAPEAKETIRFGARVTVGGEAGSERRYQIVGVDEADAASGRIAFTAPLARALLGRRVGEIAQLSTGHGEESWLIRAVAYEEDLAKE